MSDRRPSTIEPEAAERPAESSRAKTLKRDVALSPGDDVRASQALLRSTKSDPPAEPLVANASATTDDTVGFAQVCGRIRTELHNLETILVRQVLVVADLIAEAKDIYDREKGTGQRGHRNPEGIPGFNRALSNEVGLSTSMIAKYLRISKMASFQRSLVAANPAISSDFTACLELSREADPERAAAKVHQLHESRHHVADAVTRSPLLDRARSDKELRNLLKQFSDPKQALGGLGADLPIPQQLIGRFPELAGFATIGDVRRAVADGRTRARGNAAKTADPLPSGVQAIAVVVRLHPGPGNETNVEFMHKGKRCRVSIGIKSVRVPRPVMEEALARTADTGHTSDSTGTGQSVHPETAVNHERPEVSDAIVTLVVR